MNHNPESPTKTRRRGSTCTRQQWTKTWLGWQSNRAPGSALWCVTLTPYTLEVEPCSSATEVETLIPNLTLYSTPPVTNPTSKP